MTRRANLPLTADRARELFRYYPNTGNLVRRRAVGNQRAGTIAGRASSDGCYGTVSVDGISYMVHHVIWLHVTGAWPEGEIDHIDTDCTNTRWKNLRDVPQQMNRQNKRRAHRHNVSGLLGVTYRKDADCYVARITVNKKVMNLGMHQTAEAAHAAYVAAKRVLHAGCTL